MLEAVARAGADQEDVGPARVDVDQQVAVGAVLILADARLAERRAGEAGEAALHVGAHLGESGGRGAAVAAVGVDRRPVLVVGDLEAAALEVREAVVDVAGVEIGPAGQAAGPKRSSPASGAKKNTSCRVGKIRRPSSRGTASAARGRRRRRSGRRIRLAALHDDALQRAAPPARRRRTAARRYSPPARDELGDQRLHRAPRHQRSELGLAQAELDPVESIIGKRRRMLGPLQQLGRQLEPAMHLDRLLGHNPPRPGRRTARRPGGTGAARPAPRGRAIRRASPRPCAYRPRRRRSCRGSSAIPRRTRRGHGPGPRRRAAAPAAPPAAAARRCRRRTRRRRRRSYRARGDAATAGASTAATAAAAAPALIADRRVILAIHPSEGRQHLGWPVTSQAFSPSLPGGPTCIASATVWRIFRPARPPP